MYCRNCGKTVNDKAAVCIACGVPPLTERNFCQECGVETKSNQVVCTKCGVSLEVGKNKKGFLSSSNNKGYEGFYRSSDDKIIFGFCGGLAHKFGIPTSTVRILTFISGFFVIGWLYFVGIFLPKYPTKNI